MKKLLLIAGICLAFYGTLLGQAWPNGDFTDNLLSWRVEYNYETGTGDTIEPGHVEHSSYLGGSAYLMVSGAPSAIGLMNFAEQTLYPGNTIKMLVEHTDIVNIGGITLNIGGGPYGEVATCPEPAGTYLVTLTLTKL